MARMTLGQGHTKATEAAAALQRLSTAVTTDPKGVHYGREIRRLARATSHELETAQRLLAELTAGLAGIGPARSGQLGGQRQGGHATSAAALELVAPKAGTQRDLVLQAVRRWARPSSAHPATGKWQGLTDVQLSHHTGLPPNSVRPRRVELVDAGWLEDSGLRRQHNGRDHVVWTLTAAARHTGQATTTDRSTTP